MNAPDPLFRKIDLALATSTAKCTHTTKPKVLAQRHVARLRQIHRSSGWPCRDLIEIELLLAGLVQATQDSEARETLHLTTLGHQALVAASESHRAARSTHEELVHRVTSSLQAQGRIVWNEIALRAQDSGTWVTGVADVFSIRSTTVEGYLDPIVHEVKVSRSNLLQDLRNPSKRGAYMDMAPQVYYVLACDSDGEAIARPEEIPQECGVIIATGDALDVARVAPKRAFTGFRLDIWMSLAKTSPAPTQEDVNQLLL